MIEPFGKNDSIFAFFLNPNWTIPLVNSHCRTFQISHNHVYSNKSFQFKQISRRKSWQNYFLLKISDPCKPFLHINHWGYILPKNFIRLDWRTQTISFLLFVLCWSLVCFFLFACQISLFYPFPLVSFAFLFLITHPCIDLWNYNLSHFMKIVHWQYWTMTNG